MQPLLYINALFGVLNIQVVYFVTLYEPLDNEEQYDRWNLIFQNVTS